MSPGSWRLRGEVRGRPLVLEVPTERAVLGSDSACDLPLADPTISRRHAELVALPEGLEVRDLGSTNGTWVGGARLEGPRLVGIGEAVIFGRVRMYVEEVASDDLEVALPLRPADETMVGGPPSSAHDGSTTLGFMQLDALTTDGIPRLLRLLHRGSDLTSLAQAAGSAVISTLPVVEVEIRRIGGGLLFQGSSGLPGPATVVVEKVHEQVEIRASFAHESMARSLGRLIESVGQIVDMAGRRVRQTVEKEATASPPEAQPAGMVPSVDPGMNEIVQKAARVARGTVGVLILGESGTGKELLARYLHQASGRVDFVALNCAALPRDLLEAELFGVEKGAATGVEPRPGKLELANEGTLFLDEIGDMSLETQAKILRVLQEGEVLRLGSSKPSPARARVVAATNKDIRAQISAGDFRLDLFHRIAGWIVELPALRERSADIPNLAAHFLSLEARKLGRSYRGISKGALEALLAYGWPGNIRQLQQEVARAALFMEDGALLEATLLDREIRETQEERDTRGESLTTRLERYEKREITRSLAANGGNVAAAAEELGVHRATLYRRMKVLGISST